MTALAPAGTSSDGWRDRADGLFPGGVNSPVRAYRAVGGVPPILVRGKGAHVWDADGRRYLDFVGGFGPHILGHAHPAVVRAVTSAVRNGGAFGATHPSEVLLAERIRDAMPSIERIRFTSSGTEAVMSAIRVAKAATNRRFVVKFAGAYHGHSDALLVRAGSGAAALAVPDSAGVDPDVVVRTLVAPYNDLAFVERLFGQYRNRIAAVIVEPVAANMGVVPPVSGFLDGLRKVTQADGALLIFDEVITGFRVAAGGAQGRYGVVPDLTTLGKVIGGGLPIGAYGGRTELIDLVAPAGPVYQAGTMSGHPLAMAAGVATLDLLTPTLYQRLERYAGRLERGIHAQAQAARIGVSVSRIGSLLTVFFRAMPPTSFAQVLEADASKFAGFHSALKDLGVMIPPSPHEAWFVSTAHGTRGIDETISAVCAAFVVMANRRSSRNEGTPGGSTE
jgi:glutamate-1-semialdehyde 2,1-aminomutase